MKKLYEKPDAEYVSLIAREEIGSSDWVGGDVGAESSEF